MVCALGRVLWGRLEQSDGLVELMGCMIWFILGMEGRLKASLPRQGLKHLSLALDEAAYRYFPKA